MIGFKNITLKVHRQTLFDGASLHVAVGNKVVVRGASGSGKSSLLKCAVGALPTTGGSVRIDGLELSADTVAEIRGRIAFIGQEPVLGAENVRDALLLPFHFKAHCGNKPSDERISKLLERLHLSADILDKPSKRISGGEKQRIAVIRALLLDKTIFLADEVTSALDPESKAAVMAELFRPEITLLSVSHDPEWVDACDRIVEIVNNQLRESVADPKIKNQQSKIENGSIGDSHDY
ncbi:MAG: ATP-binding cassette domain-containing protein [Verrucomicrobiota bacterium]